jgi:hypothetical protein
MVFKVLVRAMGRGGMCSTPSHTSSQRWAPVERRQASKSRGTTGITARGGVDHQVASSEDMD